MTSAVSTTKLRSIIASSALTFVLAACGGGGDEPVASPAPTALPTLLTIAAPSTRQSAGSDVRLSLNTIDPGRKLSYSWSFGDGTVSADPNPAHRYSRSGSFEVKVTVTNEAGATVSSTTTIKVAELALAQGKACTGADSGGWCWQNPLPQGNLILKQAWFDVQRGWAVGESGTILKTVDGGASVVCHFDCDLRKPMDSRGWLGANHSDARRHRADLQRRHAREDTVLCRNESETPH